MTDGQDAKLHERQRRAALGTLQELRGEPALGGSALRQAGDRAARHFAGADEPGTRHEPADSIEIWGRRIGRALSLAACVGLGIYLYLTYVR